MTNKMRLIDANKADVEYISCYYGDHCYIDDVQEWLDEQPTIDAIETDAIMEEMYDFYQKTVAHAGPSKVDYIDGVYALMDHMARWFEQKEGE